MMSVFFILSCVSQTLSYTNTCISFCPTKWGCQLCSEEHGLLPGSELSGHVNLTSLTNSSSTESGPRVLSQRELSTSVKRGDFYIAQEILGNDEGECVRRVLDITWRVSWSVDPVARFVQTDIRHKVFQKWPFIVFKWGRYKNECHLYPPLL